MLEFKRILVPVDFSDISGRSLDHAQALGRFYQAEIELAHVVEPLLPGPAMPAAYAPWVTLDPAARARVESRLDELARPAREAGLRTEVRLQSGGVVAQILERARSWPADVVVMGTHGRGGFQRFFLGSVTEKVLRQAPCPVLTVPPPSVGLHPSGSILFRRILCPVDFSAASDAAVRVALSLAQESGAELTLLHAVEWLVEEEPAIRVAGFDVPEFRQHLAHDAWERLRALVPGEARDWCRPRQEVVGGRPWREILRVAQERMAELIVMGVRGRGAVDLALFGSTTHHVVRGAACPVLVVHTD
jgi:nucleotide-binding universal stress UspA family protein